MLVLSSISQGATNALIAKSSDEELKKNVKALNAGVYLMASGIAAHQVNSNGLDKTQAKISIGTNLVLGALILKDALGK